MSPESVKVVVPLVPTWVQAVPPSGERWIL